MTKILEQESRASSPSIQQPGPQETPPFMPVINMIDRHPEACIKGDISFRVTEREAGRGPVTGHYSVETKDIPEPPFFLWYAQDGEVLSCHERSSDIVFDLRGEREGQWWTPVNLPGASMGQLWTTMIAVQVMGADALDSIVSSTFIQILVIGEDALGKVA